MAGAADAEDKVNMIPLIDTMFFLILFFMIVTKFTPDEKAIASLLPTDKGQGRAASASPLQKVQVNIAVYPAGLEKGYQPSQYRQQLREMEDKGTFNQAVNIRIGGQGALLVEGGPLSDRVIASPRMKEAITNVHAYVETELAKVETDGPRKDQPPVIIHSFSGLSWKYALLAYDAVRAYEARHGKHGVLSKNSELVDAREVTFAPPRIRNYSSNELGNELYEIVHLR